MIKCTVCLTENDEFATICKQCKAFLQDRVPNLDLFETGWRILESPHKAFRIITLAEHKNYSLFLFTLFGISLSFTGFWFFRLGNRFATLLDLLPWAVGSGIILGFITAAVLPLAYFLFAKIVGGSTGYRTSIAVLGYSLTPIALSLFFVLPIELLTFGMFLFTWNPHPYTIKPLSYVLLLGFDGVVSIWSILLAVLGTKVGHQISTLKSLIVVLATLGVLAAVLFILAQLLHLPIST